MFVGRNAIIYRSISDVSIDELKEFIDIKNIELIENESCVVSDNKVASVENNTQKIVSSDTVSRYYRAINGIKQRKADLRNAKTVPLKQNVAIDKVEVQNEPQSEEIKQKTKKTRQPKIKL